MKTVEERLADSLTARSVELIQFLPYLLQDLWDLGSSPDDIGDLLAAHTPVGPGTDILDLACGKGAVSVSLAKRFGCSCLGIDIMEAFIGFAREKAIEHEVAHLCRFEVGDISEFIQASQTHDVVIYGAVGEVLGTPTETLSKLRALVKPGGFLVIDDAYVREGVDPELARGEGLLTREEWLDLFAEHELRFVAENPIDEEALRAVNHRQQPLISRRAGELKRMYPDQAELFSGYVESQLAECNELETDIVGVTILLQKSLR